MNVRDAYTNWSTTYDSDRNLTRDLDAIVTREILEPVPCQTILEMGCGTGKNTVFLASRAERVIALDFSEGMLAQARSKVTMQRVAFAIADFTAPLPLRADAVDLVTCNLVLEHIANLDAVFDQVQRVLKRGGHFLICELHPFRQYQGTVAKFARAQDTIEIPAFVHHLSDFTNAALTQNLTMLHLQEWWHQADANKPPRLVSFLWKKERSTTLAP